MRENTKWIMLATALAFVALMVFEWGADVTGRSSGGLGEIGTVNGDPVLYDEYMFVYRNLYDQVQSQQIEPITSQQNKEIEDQAFEEVVNQILVRQELERRGIRVSDDEVRQAAQFSPPPDLAGEPAFLTDGRFDLQKYQQFLATTTEQFLLQLEAYYRDVIPRGKLMRQISAGVHLTDAQLWRTWRDQNESVEVRYIPFDPGTRIADSEIAISDAEIQDYYDANPEEFEQPARVRVKVSVIDKAPTAADSAASLQRALDLRQEILDGADFGEIARLESADESTSADGGLIGVFGRGAMVPAFDTASFEAPIGQLTEPVETSFGYHLIEVLDRWGQDSASVRHILIEKRRTEDSEVAMLTLADSLEALGEQLSLDDAAAQLGLTVTEVELTSQFAFVTGAGQVSEGADWALEEAEIGDVSPVFETQQAFYALELLSSTPAGILPIEAARPAIEQQILFDKKQARSVEEAEGVVARIRAGEGLPNVAADEGLDVRSAGPFSRDDFVPGLGRQNAAIGTSFGLAPGQVSGVVTTPANTFVLEVLNRVPADSTAWVEQIDDQRAQIEAFVTNTRLQLWMSGLRDAADVVDRRAEVLQPLDEEPIQSPFGFGF